MPLLDDPVPQTVEQLQDVLKFFDALIPDPDQVIEVPKTITEDVPVRAVLRATQLAEQLVEVPTIISFSMILLLHALLEQRTVEQNVDIPAVGGSGTGGGLPGFLPGQNYSLTAEQIVDNPVPRPGGAGDLQGFPRGQGSTALSEQIPEFPDPGGGREDFQPVQGSAASSSDSPGQAGQGVFRTFLHRKKSAKIPRAQGCLAGVSLVAQHGVRLLLLVAAKQEWCFLVCSSGPPSYPVAWSNCWCKLCLATRPSWRLLEEFPLLRALCCAIRTWISGHCLRPCIFQSFGVWVLPLEHVVFGTRALLSSTVDTCFTGGYWRTSHIFYVRCTQIEAFLSIPQNGEVCTVDASSCSVSSRGSHFESGHYLYELFM